MSSNHHNNEFEHPLNSSFDNVSSTSNSPIKGAIVMLFAVLVSISGILAAANSYGNANQSSTMGKDGKQRRGPDFGAISTQLQLTDEQTGQLKTLLKAHHESRMQERKSQREKRKIEHQAKRDSHKQALDAELSEFLNEEQITNLHEILQKNRPPRRCNPPCEHHSTSNS